MRRMFVYLNNLFAVYKKYSTHYNIISIEEQLIYGKRKYL